MKKLMKKVILFLVRKRLGLRKYEWFRFINQKSTAMYRFDNDGIAKYWGGVEERSNVSLNWLLDEDCKIIRENDPGFSEFNNKLWRL